MEKTRYFRSANRLNIFVNFFSANFFPLSEEKMNFTLFTGLWVIFVWGIKVTTISTVMSGSLYFANLTVRERIKKSGAGVSVCIELIIPIIYLNLRRDDLRRLIKKYNSVLVDSDHLRKFVFDTIEPYEKGLKFYIVSCVIAVSAWAATPILTISDNHQFAYSDFSAPAYFPWAPFSANIFLVAVISQVIGSTFITFGKISIDVYINHFIAVLSAEYKYVRKLITDALSREDAQEDESSVIRSLRKCIEHHCAVIEYKFFVCSFGSANIEKVSYFVYAIGCILQIFLLCSCVQELLDVSTSVTEDAFHENWHARSSEGKKTFCIMEISSQMGCRLSAYRIVDLVVPTMAVVNENTLIILCF
ncbi:uncharacterized protein [Venturia canescens]|uniref:uncharacterized protein n=1 Tax=Venturia canescens TaxID=32260 RepID=UPI001C9CF532|nr:uncharacterized protein LOC122407158 [Venturia canescens]